MVRRCKCCNELFTPPNRLEEMCEVCIGDEDLYVSDEVNEAGEVEHILLIDREY